MRTVFGIVGLLALAGLLFVGHVYAVAPEHMEEPPAPVPAEEYPFYDQVIDDMFLTSETRLVLIERLTVTKLSPDQQNKISLETFRENGYFDGQLPMELVREFIFKNQTPSRLEARFNFGVRYRLISGDGAGQPEVSLAPIPVSLPQPIPTQEEPLEEAPPVIDRLAFSRVALTPKNDQALVYVENNRPDQTGAGLLVWLRRGGNDWDIFDTDVVWTARPREPGER